MRPVCHSRRPQPSLWLCAVALAVLWCDAALAIRFNMPSIIGEAYYVDGFSSIDDSHAIGGGDSGHVYSTGDAGATWVDVCTAHGCPSVHDDLMQLGTTPPSSRAFGDLTRVNPKGSYSHFQAATATVFTPGPSPSTPVSASVKPIASSFKGLPHNVTCHEHFGGCPLRMPSGCGRVTLKDGSKIQSGIVYWGGNGPYATSVVAFRSTDGGSSWEFVSIIANASAYPDSQEGPNENDLSLLADGTTILAVIRLDAGDGPETHPYKNYAKSTSTDGGLTWSPLVEMTNIGCARPRLKLLGNGKGPLLLSGGRARNRGTSDVLLWVNTDGMGEEWTEYSLSYWHNRMEPNASLHFTAAVNSSLVRETTSYTSLLPVGPDAALVTYGRHLPPHPDVAFSMKLEF